MSTSETIYALATPPAKSGVAVVRLSGPRALAVLKELSGFADVTPRHAHYVTLGTIDKGIALYFNAPHSFTGEDVVELQLHGSIAVIRELFDVLAAMEGLRPAEPGEFSRRAFLNGKMDLLEAEGLADLIAAETGQQKRQAMRQMQGEVSGYFDELRARILKSLAHLEAYIDFPDEEIPESVLSGLSDDIKDLQDIIGSALSDQLRGERLRDGINVVILGAPNAGKSSLLNALAGKDAAIVSARAGTTRDIIEVHMEIAGYPVVLVDTAGIRQSSDEIEEEGVRRALARAAAADIKLVLFDGASVDSDAGSRALLDAEAIPVVTKSDILIYDINKLKFKQKIFSISAKNGQGIEALLAEIEKRIVSFFSGAQAPLITRHRHRALLMETKACLEKSLRPAPLELRCEELRLAGQAVGKVTGKIAVDDVLDVIFKSFCIGK